ncbi:hypothetical protein C0J52_03459 [Blattella germanica]|nr:hypothetical protein C0J52_03459 [Blattella germanica]
MRFAATAVWKLRVLNLLPVVLFTLNTVPPSDSTDVVCPDPCWCDTLDGKYLTVCMDHNLTAVPQYFDKKTQEIVLMFQNIDIIPDYVFHGLQNISILLMQYNNIKELREQAFDGLYNLVYLDLSHNSITIMPARIVQNNEKIKFLYLNHNDIMITGPILISPSLSLLDVSFCRITFLPHDAFIGIPRLTKLKINNNYITELEAYAFRGLKRLEVLIAGNNEITDFGPTIFQELDELRYVDFSNNSISSIPYNLFENNRKLRYLFLQNNTLLFPYTGPLLVSNSLSHLDISFCNISFISNDAFKKLPNLATLRMVGNPLVRFDPQMVYPLTKLQVILFGPEASCSEASFKEIFEYFQENSVVYYAPPLCHTVATANDSKEVESPPTISYNAIPEIKIINDVIKTTRFPVLNSSSNKNMISPIHIGFVILCSFTICR